MDSLKMIFESLHNHSDIALFLMRLMVGGLFFYSGQQKIRKLKHFAERHKLPLPIALGTVLFELIGGLMLILGIFSQIAALMIILVMLGAISFHIFKWKSPYWASKGGWEYDLMWVVMCLVILTSGGGEIGIYPGA